MSSVPHPAPQKKATLFKPKNGTFDQYDDRSKELIDQVAKKAQCTPSGGIKTKEEAREFFMEVLSQKGEFSAQNCYVVDKWGFEYEFGEEAFNEMFLQISGELDKKAIPEQEMLRYICRALKFDQTNSE